MNREIKIFGKKINFELNSQADESVFEEVFVDRDYKVVDEIIRVTKKDGQILLEIKNGLNLAICYLYWETRKVKPLIMHPINPITFIKYIRKKKSRVKTYFIGAGYWFAPFILFDIRT